MVNIKIKKIIMMIIIIIIIIKFRTCGTIVLLVVLYAFEIWSLTLREEHRMMVYENRVLRRIFGSKRDEVTGKWRKLRKEELYYLYCSPNIIRMIKWRRMRWAGHVARMKGRIGVYTILVRKCDWKETTWMTWAWMGE